jgi:Protein of unknown function (Hypoth_ymh)
MGKYDGLDLDRITAELNACVHQTTPQNLSGGNFITPQCGPTCGRTAALELTERVRPILDTLYPEWRDDNESDPNFEFAVERDACERLLSRIASDEEITSMLAGYDASPRLSANQLHALVWRSASAQWSTGHRHEAVLAAAKAVNSMLQAKLGRRDASDVKLVREAFSENDPETGRPRLRFPEIQDEQTRESMRQGAMNFGSGCFQAIRNPLGHLLNEEVELSEQEASERIALAGDLNGHRYTQLAPSPFATAKAASQAALRARRKLAAALERDV